MKCQICKKNTKRKKKCSSCQEDQLWHKYYQVQKTATLAKCKKQKIRKSTLVDYLKKSIQKFEGHIVSQY